jgi:signal transduction histidine kinase
MRIGAPDHDDGAVSTTQHALEQGAGGQPAERPRLFRRPDAGVLGGVAAGIAEHLGLRVALVRVLFAILACAGGLGVALYGAYWIVLPAPPDAPPPRLPRWLEYVIAAAGAVAAIAWIGWAVPLGGLFAPALLACLGGALIWRQASESERGRWRRLSRTSLASGGGEKAGRVRLVAGAVLVAGGAALVLRRADFTALRDGLLAMVVTVLGLALLTGPWWMRLVAQLGAERSERIRSQERADIAAHLHDSVLQTLALIQRNAGSPREVIRLARGQERELRTLLYGPPAASGQLSTALRTAAAEVEDAYALAVDVVVVGDATLDEALAALCAATREALVNAAKHSGAEAASVYAEIEPGAVTVFVRDRGSGFDPERVAEDRQGVRGSIIARVERYGGRVRIRSSADSGTEVEMRVPR